MTLKMKLNFNRTSFCDLICKRYEEGFQREQSAVFLLETKNVWEILLQITVPEAEKWQK